jgi:hypothetical protein
LRRDYSIKREPTSDHGEQEFFRPVAFRTLLTDGLALSENSPLISNQESIVKGYLEDVLKSKTD